MNSVDLWEREGYGFLTKKNLHQLLRDGQEVMHTNSDENDSIAMVTIDEEETIIHEDDNATIQTPGSISLCQYEYHVLYSLSYSVPVLYFNASKEDGKLLSLEEVWNNVPGSYQSRISDDRWSFITQQEHPLLCRPFYQLHPCHTADMMQAIGIDWSCQDNNYLISWLSTVGPVVGLNLALSYGTLGKG
ncbi:ubiquitin-like-conjugating enzyme ATG10 [Glandiceps talaboti]